MNHASIRVEPLIIPTYVQPGKEELPIFSEHRVHQRSGGRPYPNKVTTELRRDKREEVTYQAVHMENDYLDIWLLPELGGRVFAAKDKRTGYDFFYRQHVIKPGLIGAFGSWISGGIEFNWPYHHSPSGLMPWDFEIEQSDDGSAICWMFEHDPVDRMKAVIGIVLRPDTAYLETRVKVCNRTPVNKSFLWWENAAVPVNESYQLFFPKDVTYVNFHYLDSRISFPIAGDSTYNGMDMRKARDISWHKNTRDATSYFACASKYDFFGGYDHGKECGVVHVADHHIAPGKKMFTWAYNNLSKNWENTLTDTDGQYAELMAGSYTDNQPNFSWLEPYETKEFSQFWYPIQKIGTPDFANLNCAISLHNDKIWVLGTKDYGEISVKVTTNNNTLIEKTLTLNANEPVAIEWEKPNEYVSISIIANGKVIGSYTEELQDNLKKPPVKDPMPVAAEMTSADDLYLAGVHVQQYRDPLVMPDAYWLEALKRNPYHAPSLLAMANYSYEMGNLDDARDYVDQAIAQLTKYNNRTFTGDPYFIKGLILEAQGRLDEAYDNYRIAAWNGSCVPKAMSKAACIALHKGDYENAIAHAKLALSRDDLHPIAPAVLVLAYNATGQSDKAQSIIDTTMNNDRFNVLIRWLGGSSKEDFLQSLKCNQDQVLLDAVFDFEAMGAINEAIDLINEFGKYYPQTVVTKYTLAYLQSQLGKEYIISITEADQLTLANTYPNRLEEIRVLEFALAHGGKKAAFLLGCAYYDKRHYKKAADLFKIAINVEPENYMAYRSLAVAYASHLNHKEEAVTLMHKALEVKFTQQLLFEFATLLDMLCYDPKDKITLLEPYASQFTRDELFVELAKAYNQNFEPKKARDLMLSHTFISCEGGEHTIAEQYMYSFFLEGMELLNNKQYEEAYDTFSQALTLPKSLGSGIWNRCRYIPYRFEMAKCLENMDRADEAKVIYEEILDIEVEFFSNMYLRELPIYQAYCAKALGLEQRAWNILGKSKREWTKALTQKDNGFFATTPFYISFIPQPSEARKGCYSFLLGMIARYEGRTELAEKLIADGYKYGSDNMLCHYFHFKK